MASRRNRPETVKPPTYWIWQRCADAWHAGRDAEAARRVSTTPAGSDPAAPTWESPHTLFLGQLGRARAEKVWSTFAIEVQESEVSLAQHREQRRAAQETIRRLTGELEQNPGPSPADLEAVHAGEEAADVRVRVGRRSREHHARRAETRGDLRRAQTTEEAAGAEIARLEETVAQQRRTAQTRVAMIDAYVKRRRSAYLTRLVRKHPEGPRMSLPKEPGWGETPSVGPGLTATKEQA